MNEVSVIINGIRYDAERLENASMTDVCKYCDLYNKNGNSECLKLNACPLFSGYIFKKSTKSFVKYKWIDVKDRLPEKGEDCLCIVELIDGTTSAEIRWRRITDDVYADENGFAIYPPVEEKVLAWLPIPEYKE